MFEAFRHIIDAALVLITGEIGTGKTHTRAMQNRSRRKDKPIASLCYAALAVLRAELEKIPRSLQVDGWQGFDLALL